MSDLVLVHTRCHFCHAPYQREIEPEYAVVVQRSGICTPCYDQQEAAREMAE